MFSMLTPQQWLGVGLLALYAVFRLFGAQLSAAASSAWNRPWFSGSVGGQTLSPTLDDETRAIESAKFLLKWFPPGSSGRTAAKNCWTCLFDKDAPGS